MELKKRKSQPGGTAANIHWSMLAIFAGMAVNIAGWLLLSAIWNNLAPDYDEKSFLAVWRIPQVAQRSLAGFAAGYAAAWVAGGSSLRKVVHAGIAAAQFLLVVSGMVKEYPLPYWLVVTIDPGIPAILTVLGGWFEWRHPFVPRND